jgi:heme-degrading monooxygenase HmoA
MVIQVVKFKTALSDAEVQRLFEERAPQYRALPGLIQKYYVRENQTGEYGGIYVWDSAESLRAVRASDLARSIPAVYRVTGQPRAEVFEVLLTLKEDKMTAMSLESIGGKQ